MLGVHLMTWGAYQSGWFHVENYVAAAISVDWIDLKILTVLSSWERDFMDFVLENQQRSHWCMIHLVVSKMLSFLLP